MDGWMWQIKMHFRSVLLTVFWANVCRMVCPMLSDCSVLCVVSVMVYCGETVAWIKMSLGVEIGLSPGHIVLDGDPAPAPMERGTAAPHFHNLWVQALPASV